jgi:hypothetical protein
MNFDISMPKFKGELTKLKITAFKKPDATPASEVRTFEVMLNPSTYTKKLEIEYKNEEAQGAIDAEQRFVSMKPQDFTLDFLIDGTGVMGEKVNVENKINEFLTFAYYYEGEIHRPYYLRVAWGTFSQTCVMKSCDINYSLFEPNGTPLRAKITAVFTSYKTKALQQAEKKPSSTDLTHIRETKDSDHLVLMTDKILEDPLRYLEVARANDLNHFRRLKAGQKLFFPPIQ